MTTSHAEVSPVDHNVTRALELLRVYRELSHKELIVASGIGKSKMIRRRDKGGWTAAEIDQLARALDVEVSVFYNGADALLNIVRRAEAPGPTPEPGVNARYGSENLTFTWDAA